MSSSLIVEYLDEVEEGHLGLAATEEMLPKLVLDRGEPALDDGVVVAVAPVGSCSRSCHASQGDVGSLCWHTDCPDRSDARAPRPVGDVSVPWCINTGKSLIPLTLLFLAQKRNLLIPLELSGVMHQGTLLSDISFAYFEGGDIGGKVLAQAELWRTLLQPSLWRSYVPGLVELVGRPEPEAHHVMMVLRLIEEAPGDPIAALPRPARRRARAARATEMWEAFFARARALSVEDPDP